MRVSAGALVLVMTGCGLLTGQSASKKSTAKQPATPPSPVERAESKPQPALGPKITAASGERLTYNVEWRLVHAGTAAIEERPGWAQLKLETAGLVSSMFKVEDTYTINYDDPFCVSTAFMDAKEGKKHTETRVLYDRVQNHAFYNERDVLRDAVIHTGGVDVPVCVQDVISALLKLRTSPVDPPHSIQLFVSDGRKSGSVKVEAQEREEVRTPLANYKAIRYEANLLNGVVYTRRGRVFVWINDSGERRIVQIQLRMGFPIGTVTLRLAKQEPI